MTRNKGMALYLDPAVDSDTPDAIRAPRAPRSALKTIILGFMAFALLIGGIAPALMGSSNTVAAEAGEDGFLPFVCAAPDDLGGGMNSRGGWQGATQRYSEMELTGRTWTAQELFASNMTLPHYNGEGPKDKITFVRGTGKGVDRPAEAAKAGQIEQSVADALGGDAAGKLQGARSFWGCTFGGLNSGMANAGFSLSSIVTSWVGIFATAAFDSSMICSDVDDTGCLNLLKIIGGEGGEDEGVIGTLTSSIYFPLLALVVLITALWVAYVGISKRRFREALTGALWMFAAIVVGTAFLLNPAMIAKAPMTVANSVGSCVIGAFNGTNCFNGGSTSGSEIESSDAICKSDAADANTSQAMTLAVNGMGCSIWKAFVLEPYSQASFGMSFDALDATDPSDGLSEQFEKAGITDPESTFKVNLQSSSSGEDMEGKTVVLDQSPAVSNVALYQLYLMTDADAGDAAYDKVKGGGLDGRWYNIVAVTSADDAMWDKWSGSFTGAAGQNALAAMSLVTAVLGGFIILITALLAIVYYVITIVLMGVAPLFFLAAIHPGRGRRLFLGWFGQIAGNVLKYIASAFFLVITVALYAGVLSNSDNLATTFLFILILTAALFMYRGEIVNLLGRAEMGGEALSSRLGDSMRERGSRSLRRGGNAVLGLAGSAVGGAVATGSGAKPSEYFKNAGAGLKDNISRELKRKSGFAGNIARQADRVSADNRRDLRATSDKYGKESTAASGLAENADATAASNQSELQATEAGLQSDKIRLDDFNTRAEVAHTVQHEVLGGMEESNPAFAKAQGIANQLSDLEMQHSQAVASGDSARATELSGQIQATRDAYGAANAELTPADRARGERRYATMSRKGMEAQGVKYDEADRHAHMETQDRVAAAEVAIEPLRATSSSAQDAATQARARAAALDARADVVHQSSQDWKPGEKMTTAQTVKARDAADAKAWDAYREAGGNMDNFSTSTGIDESPALKKHIEETQKTEAKEVKREDKAAAKETKAAEKERIANVPEPKRETIAERKVREEKEAADATKYARASRDAHQAASQAPNDKPATDSKPQAETKPVSDAKPQTEAKPANPPKPQAESTPPKPAPASPPKPANDSEPAPEPKREAPEQPKPAQPSPKPVEPVKSEPEKVKPDNSPKITIEAHDWSGGDSPTSIPGNLTKDDNDE